jgi:hypothetical protein
MSSRLVLGLGGTVDYEIDWDSGVIEALIAEYAIRAAELDQRIPVETENEAVRAAVELGWDDERRADEVDHYLRRVEAERQSQTMPTDQEADEARVSAPDIV